MQNCGIVKTFHKKNCIEYSCECNESEGFQLKMEYFQNNGIKEGLCRKYYYNGNLQYEYNYIQNKKNGIFKKILYEWIFRI